MNAENIRILIELSTSFEEADRIISQYTEFKTVKEKIAFLKGLFYDYKIVIIDQKKEDPDEYIYRLLLNAIVEKKFR